MPIERPNLEFANAASDSAGKLPLPCLILPISSINADQKPLLIVNCENRLRRRHEINVVIY